MSSITIDNYEASGLEVLGILSLLLGVLVMLAGLWFSAGGLRVVVSGRIDERRRSANSLKWGLILLVVGACLLFVGLWLSR